MEVGGQGREELWEMKKGREVKEGGRVEGGQR